MNYDSGHKMTYEDASDFVSVFVCIYHMILAFVILSKTKNNLICYHSKNGPAIHFTMSLEGERLSRTVKCYSISATKCLLR